MKHDLLKTLDLRHDFGKSYGFIPSPVFSFNSEAGMKPNKVFFKSILSVFVIITLLASFTGEVQGDPEINLGGSYGIGGNVDVVRCRVVPGTFQESSSQLKNTPRYTPHPPYDFFSRGLYYNPVNTANKLSYIIRYSFTDRVGGRLLKPLNVNAAFLIIIRFPIHNKYYKAE